MYRIVEWSSILIQHPFSLHTYYTQCSNFRLPLFGDLSTNTLILIASKCPPPEPRHAVNLVNNPRLISLSSCLTPTMSYLLHRSRSPSADLLTHGHPAIAHISPPESSLCYKTCIVSPFLPAPSPVRLTLLPRQHTPRNRGPRACDTARDRPLNEHHGTHRSSVEASQPASARHALTWRTQPTSEQRGCLGTT